MSLDPPTIENLAAPGAPFRSFDERVAAVFGLVAGAGATLADAAPTGSSGTDRVLVFVAVALATWAAARASWTVLVVAAAVAVAIGVSVVPIVLGVLAAAAAVAAPLVVRRTDGSLPPWLATGASHGCSAALLLNALIRSELGGFHGLSAVLGVGVAVAAGVAGLAARPRRIKRVAAFAAVIVIVAAGAAVALAAIALTGAREDLADGASETRRAVQAVDTGRYVDGSSRLATAAEHFAAADDRLSGGLLAPAELIPGVAQNLRAVRTLSGEAERSLATAADALAVVDPTELRVVGGAIDIDAVRDVEAPLRSVRVAFAEFRGELDGVRSPWLVAPLQDELVEVADELDDGLPALDNAIEAVRLAPGFLGADGERVYLMLFTTPAEARGLGGFIGNYAEIRTDQGRIEVSAFGRRQRLDRLLTEAGGGVCTGCSQELLDGYGRRGLTLGPNGGVADQVWSTLSEPSHFPYVGEAAASLYPLSGGTELDGVIVADPYVLQALMTFTGPIPVRELDTRVLPRQAARFIIEDQYQLTDDRPERVDALDTLATAVITRLLQDASPPPARLASELAPLIDERRLLMWSADPAERDLFERIGLLGQLPEPTADGFAVSVTNEGGSKLDAFLDETVTIERREDGSGGRLVATVELDNGAPSNGLPEYVIGNSLDLPLGTSQLYVRLYGPSVPARIVVDGDEVSAPTYTEAGWVVAGFSIVIPPGETATVTVEYPSTAAAGPASVEASPNGTGATSQALTPAWEQPLATRDND